MRIFSSEISLLELSLLELEEISMSSIIYLGISFSLITCLNLS